MSVHWASILGVAAPTVLAAYAIGVQRRDRKTDRAEAQRNREQAQRDAAHSAARADRAEAIAERAVKAHEQVAASQPVRQPWTLEHLVGDTFVLTNASHVTAHFVHIDLGQLGGAFGEVLDANEVEPGGVMRFMTVKTMNVSDDTVTVTWVTLLGGADRRTWKRPLPPTPVASVP